MELGPLLRSHSMQNSDLLNLYRVMFTARQLEGVEQQLVARGEAFFYTSSAGHEATVALASHLTDADWLHCHYRDKALLLARGIELEAYLGTLLCLETPFTQGRQMTPFMSNPDLHVLSMTTPVGNNGLQSAGIAAAIKNQPGAPIVYCGVGDGGAQQGEFLEACGEAVREHLPVLFVVQDNRWAISTPTQGRTPYSLPKGEASEFWGMPIERINGRDILASYEQFGRVVSRMREDRGPAFVVLDVDRLDSHTNADDQTLYRSAKEIEHARAKGDPIKNCRKLLLERGVDAATLEVLEDEVSRRCADAKTKTLAAATPYTAFTAKRALPVELTHPSRERRDAEGGLPKTMRESLNDVLRQRLAHDANVVLFGEDIEDPKGDVFGVTKGLSTEFPQQVKNAPLSESTILGVSIGRAMTGQHPVAFIQFADFLPTALNQIITELGTLHWRTAGDWDAPVIVMAACGGYRPGLGPFHSQSMESLIAHVPGIDVMLPSNAADAAGMLNAAFESKRPTVFFYPKACLNDPRNVLLGSTKKHFAPIGTSRKSRLGRDITLVGWGNAMRLCEEAAEHLETVGIEAEVIDLRYISPWDEHAVVSSAEKTARLIVVHEDNHTCGFGAEVLATVAEKTRVPVAARRVTRADTWIPCNFQNQLDVLPSLKSVLNVAAELLDLEISWQTPPESVAGEFVVEAIGSGPADETVNVVEILVTPGQTVRAGDVLASLEATKSVFDLSAPVDGVVADVLVADGDTIHVGAPLFKLKTEAVGATARVRTLPVADVPTLVRKPTTGRMLLPRGGGRPRRFSVGISAVQTQRGGRAVSNQDLLRNLGDISSADIVRRTGIESRPWIAQGEGAISLGIDACRKVLDQEGLIPEDLDLVICSTTSPDAVTPSMACRILNGLNSGASDALAQAFDINAACSGYLYALQAGYDYLQSTPGGRVLVVTTEVLSPLLDPTDFDTSIIFGDAASATIMYGEDYLDRAACQLQRPELAAKSEDGSSLSVPVSGAGFIQMKGRRVFTEAVRLMVSSLNRVCQHAQLDVNDLRMVVPHQANQRILDAVQNRLATPVYSNIRLNGNTSSTSIPLCLDEVIPKLEKGDRIGLCAFGGGFTFGAGIIEAQK